jgi:hypothetical protein
MVTRQRPTETGSERETLTQLLDFLRSTVVHKVSGLTDEQAFSRPVPASALTPAGVVKHLTGVERFWFSIDFAGLDVEHPWPEDDPHGAFGIAPGDTVAGLIDAYESECERSRRAIAGADLDDVARGDDMTFVLRAGAHGRGDGPALRPPRPAARVDRRPTRPVVRPPPGSPRCRRRPWSSPAGRA